MKKLKEWWVNSLLNDFLIKFYDTLKAWSKSIIK